MKAIDSDHQNSYIKHRQRVKRAKAIIDNRPPLLDVNYYAGFSQLKDDVGTAREIYKNNTWLLIGINRVLRTKGEIDTFRTEENCLTPEYDKLPHKYRQIEKLEFENRHIGRKILCAKAELDTWLEDIFKRKVNKKKSTPFQYPSAIMEKYSQINIPHDPNISLRKFFRPKIWFNLEVKDVRPLGRIVIELFTEAAPQVVMEFVRFCYAKERERLNFVRLFPSLWLQGELKLDENSLLRKNVEYDKRCLDNGRYAGVLSFSLGTLRSCAESFVPFAISFKPLRVCNGRRVGFGRVCKGLKILSSIEYFGTKNGKPTKEIIVTNCGAFV